MPRSIAIARMIMLIVAASYLLSAALLAVARARGQAVTGWVIVGWLLTGAAGVALALCLAPGRAGALIVLALVLGIWMGYALIGDLRARHWIIAAIDVSALVAIVYSVHIALPDIR